MPYAAPFDLSGKVAVITGAASGLGAEFAQAMAQAGARVVCADLNSEGSERTAADVQALGSEALVVTCDVTDETSVAEMVDRAVERFGRVDILFNNAGISESTPARAHEYDIESWHRVIDVDLHGVLYCAKHCLKVMLEQGSGKVVNIASIWGIVGTASLFPGPAYSAAKGAVVNLTHELGLEYAKDGIQVNAICPGFFSTRLADGIYDDPEFVAAASAFTPMGRIAAAQEIRGAAIFLASDASNFMTGQKLVLDGGVSPRDGRGARRRTDTLARRRNPPRRERPAGRRRGDVSKEIVWRV